jgi:hypothetical protein
MSEDLAMLRSLLGATTELWAGASGVQVEPGRWSAFSGARSVDYNVIMVHAASGGTLLTRSVEEVKEARVPALLMVGGEALGEVQHLVEASWVCIGSVPFMALDLHGSPADRQGIDGGQAAVRRLDEEAAEAARALVDEVFGVGPELALVAIPRETSSRPGQSVWGAFDDGGELASCLAAVRAEDIVGIWSMATRASARQRGHGARVLRAALADAAGAGARMSLLHSSVDGERFYAAIGYRVLERWQLWSRPRWVLGRA